MYPIRFGWLRGVQVVVVSSTSMKTIALQLASELGCAHVTIETRRFPDTEGYIRVGTDDIESIRNERVIVVSNTFPDSGIVETLLILDCIKDLRNGDLSNYNLSLIHISEPTRPY